MGAAKGRRRTRRVPPPEERTQSRRIAYWHGRRGDPLGALIAPCASLRPQNFRAICRLSTRTARLFEHVRLSRSPLCLRSRTLLSTTTREPLARNRRDAGLGRALPRLE